MTMQANRGPNFIIIGAQKSGTTSLYCHLTAHPAIVPASVKQLNFFSHDNFRLGCDWYLSQFPVKEPDALAGEASPYYMAHPHAPRRIFKFNPKIKLIAVLRNPVDRSYSHYQHQVRNGREPLSFEDAIAREGERLESELARMIDDETYTSKIHRRHSYLARSRYVEHLQRWYARFARNQILVLNSEPMFADPEPVLDTVTSFLGLPPLRLETYEKHMLGSYVEAMHSETRRKLVRYFRPYNERLYALLGATYAWDV